MDNKALEVKNAADIVEIIGEIVPLKKTGKDYLGSCPFHTEKTPSFTVSPAKQMFYCFGCGAGGDVFRFLMQQSGITFFEALKILAARYGIDLPKNSHAASSYTYKPITCHLQPATRDPQSTWTPSQYSDPPEVWQAKAAVFVEWTHGKLMENQDQLKFLADRGINKDTVAKFKLGWNPGKDGKDLFRPREYWGLPTEIKEKTGKPKKLWFPIGLVIPLVLSDQVIRLRIRRPEGKKPKYYVISGSSMAMMNINPEKIRGYIIVEAELDAILLHQVTGDRVGVMASGSVSSRPDRYAAEILKDSLCILNALDSDNNVYRHNLWWKKHFPQTKRWPVPAAKDPGEAYQSGVNLREWVISGLPPALTIHRRIGRSFLVCNKKEMDSENNTLEPAKEISDSVNTLAEMLCKYPVRILNHQRETKMLQNDKWASSNWEISKKISAGPPGSR